jgi:hypothetical protein
MADLDSDDVVKYPILRRIDHGEILGLARIVWENQKSVAENIASDATRLISEAYDKNPAFFGSKSKKWILGGLFYILGQKYKEPRTQKQMAYLFGTNEVTIRNSFQNWTRLLKILKMRLGFRLCGFAKTVRTMFQYLWPPNVLNSP